MLAPCLLQTTTAIFISTTILLRTSPVVGDDVVSNVYPLNEAIYNILKGEVCNNVPALTGGANQNYTWSNTITKNDIYELAFLTLGYQLTSEADAHLPFDLGWKKTVTDHIANIAKTTCDTPVISSKFISGVKNLFQFYLLKANKSASATDNQHAEPDEVAWSIMTKELEKCANMVKPIQLTYKCGLVSQYMDKDGNLQNVDIVEELFDNEFLKGSSRGIDVIVDSIWWMFATTFARCYAALYPDKDYIVHLFPSFRDDVLRFFQNRWRGAGEFLKDFNLVFGSVKVAEEHRNLRYCTYASFAYEGLLEQHLIRPVVSFEGSMPKANYKVSEIDVIDTEESIEPEA